MPRPLTGACLPVLDTQVGYGAGAVHLAALQHRRQPLAHPHFRLALGAYLRRQGRPRGHHRAWSGAW